MPSWRLPRACGGCAQPPVGRPGSPHPREVTPRSGRACLARASQRGSRIGQIGPPAEDIRWSRPSRPARIVLAAKGDGLSRTELALEYAAEQLAAGFRAMTMLAGYVRRGGRPAAVAPTIPLRPGEKQYGWFPVTVDGERRLAVVTNRRLIVGDEVELSRIERVRPVPGEWSVALDLPG